MSAPERIWITECGKCHGRLAMQVEPFSCGVGPYVPAARIAALEAQLAAAEARARDMHRRAQKAEGKLSRTVEHLKWLVGVMMSRKDWWGARHVRAAAQHTRASSGAGFDIRWAYFSEKDRQLIEALRKRAEAAEARLAEVTGEATGTP